ncbi:basic proline-rich protein-like [Poecile atricapillus]|uniref:basic proline-rich protein-like n=1 Tax=Poecile atricapillus TaxID=48891 RepID=UPI002739E069|nr:basic proline-rich protein-like [Poecile atricapillus]
MSCGQPPLIQSPRAPRTFPKASQPATMPHDAPSVPPTGVLPTFPVCALCVLPQCPADPPGAPVCPSQLPGGQSPVPHRAPQSPTEPHTPSLRGQPPSPYGHRPVAAEPPGCATDCPRCPADARDVLWPVPSTAEPPPHCPGNSPQRPTSLPGTRCPPCRRPPAVGGPSRRAPPRPVRGCG